MKTQEQTSPKTVARTIRFASKAQVDLIREAASKQDLPFNTIVTQASEAAARQLLKSKPRDSKKVVAAAVHEANTGR